MGDTTLTLDESIKQQLAAHRTDAHGSWGDTLEEMMTILPPSDDYQEGCLNCGRGPRDPNRPSESGGVIQFFSVEQGDQTITGSNYYCSPECAHEKQEEVNAMVPTEPDAVIVGGRSELRTVVEGATFHLDEHTMEVGLDVPGAFGGQDSHGDEYDYIGEPVYVENNGQIVQEGVVEEIYHEETHTSLLLGHDHEVTQLNHPDEEVREEYEEMHAKWTEDECAACGKPMRYMVDDPPEECPHCDAEEW